MFKGKEKMDMSDSKVKGGEFVVVAVRHFMNGEHHWLAPEAGMEYVDDPFAFGENGEVFGNYYGKPVFEALKDAEDWAMSLMRGGWALAEFEARRPTFLVVEEKTFIEVMTSEDSIALPKEAEYWSDAKMDDYERELDIRKFEENKLWDSDSDEETKYARKMGWSAE